jgi:hypothetical protein
MFKKIGALLFTVLGAALLVYSATRSLDFIELTLPEDRKILAYFGLAALDGGLIAWLVVLHVRMLAAAGNVLSVLLWCALTSWALLPCSRLTRCISTGKAGMTEAMNPSQITNAVLALSGDYRVEHYRNHCIPLNRS